MAGVERGRVNSFDWGSEVSLVSNYREPWVGLLVFLLHTSTSIKNVRMLVFLCFFFLQFAFFGFFGRSSVQAPVCFLEQVLICSLF